MCFLDFNTCTSTISKNSQFHHFEKIIIKFVKWLLFALHTFVTGLDQFSDAIQSIIVLAFNHTIKNYYGNMVRDQYYNRSIRVIERMSCEQHKKSLKGLFNFCPDFVVDGDFLLPSKINSWNFQQMLDFRLSEISQNFSSPLDNFSAFFLGNDEKKVV